MKANVLACLLFSMCEKVQSKGTTTYNEVCGLSSGIRKNDQGSGHIGPWLQKKLKLSSIARKLHGPLHTTRRKHSAQLRLELGVEPSNLPRSSEKGSC
ncbi:hypothetical protein LINPERPRIM_LOCUS19958 [Linum perenne]